MVTPLSRNVADYGARGEGVTPDTRAIQGAIDEGAGTVVIPPGRFLIGAIVLRDNVRLCLEPGAILLGSENIQDYPVIQARWEGVTRQTYAPLIGGTGLKNIGISGRGTIDGQGNVWWQRHREKSLAYPRPRLISFSDSTNVLIEGVTLTNSPSWTINPVRCENVTVDKVTIINPADSPNTDGINPDSCSNVHISNCHVDVGDDCITIKSGIETEAPELCAPCENIAVTNCTMVHGHGGVVIGSEMSGSVRNVVISNCVFVGTDRGIRLKSRRGRGGIIEDIRVNNIVMQEVQCPFTMNLYYHINKRGDPIVSDKNPRPIDAGTPRFHRLHFSHITAREVRVAAAYLFGLPEMPIEDVSFDDVSISMATKAQAGAPEMADNIPPMQRAGFFARNVRGLRLRDVRIENQIGEPFLIAESDVERN